MRPRLLFFALIIALIFPQVVFSEETETTNEWYSDVEENHVYYDAISYMTDQEYVQGYDDGTFGPTIEVNRAEALKMILEPIGLEFTAEDIEIKLPPDVHEDQWYYSYIRDAFRAGIVSGHDDGFFRPTYTVNRVEALKMLLLATDTELPSVDSDEWYAPYLSYGITNALIVPNSDLDYLPAEPLTRGELSELIYRFYNDIYSDNIEFGLATYYGDSFNGRNTASGATLDTSAAMAAHLTLPFGTWVRVTNLNTDLSVDVEIVDRGPYGEGRIIDLTPTYFDKIGALSSGILNVRVEVLK